MDPIETAILALVTARGPTKSICPSEAARALDEDWHPKLGPVRATAIRMAKEGRLTILRKGRPVTDFADLRGVIRLRGV
jgi:hypothetical protein